MSNSLTPNHSKTLTNYPKWEFSILCISFAIYILWQLNAILHHGSWGQDFGAHVTWIHMAISDPINWLTTYDGSRTNPPMFHYIASLIFRIIHSEYHALEVVATVSMLANAAAIYLLYRVMRRIITVPAMRLACLIFILFLPFAMIHAVVLAADSLATPCFLFLVYLFTLLTENQTNRSFKFIVSAIAFLLTFSLTVKFTFISLVPASVLIYIALYRAGHLSLKRALIGISMILLIPAIFGTLELHHYRSSVKYNLGITKEWQNPITSPFLNLRSLLMVKKEDGYLLTAPSYNFSLDGNSYDLLHPNYYSYPGLLHLAMFTDILNVYQFDPVKKSYFGPRTEKAEKLMSLSVKGGIFFSIAAVVAVPFMIFMCFLQIWKRKGDLWAIGIIIALLSSAFYLNIVLFLPEIPAAYAGGYWLPRLVAPALICFFVLTFTFGDRVLIRHFQKFGWVILTLVIIQSILHLSFLWPWNWNNEKIIRDDSVVRGYAPEVAIRK